MNELKLALSKESNTLRTKSKDKSKSESIWVGDDSPLTNKKCHQKKLDSSTSFLEHKILDSFLFEKKISQTTFERIIQEFQQQFGKQKSEISYLIAIEDRLSDLIQQHSSQKQKYIQSFRLMVESKIQQIRDKQKKSSLLQFDQILNKKLKINPKINQEKQQQNKIGNFLEVNQHMRGVKSREKSFSKSREKSKNKNHDKSGQKPLNKLLGKQKNFAHEKHQKGVNQTQSDFGQQNMSSYSAIMSASCAVKQRNRPRRNTKKRIVDTQHDKHQEQQEDKKQKAFVFYRPKKGK